MILEDQSVFCIQACRDQLTAEVFFLGFFHIKERFAHFSGAVAEHSHCFLDGNGVHVGEERVDEGEIFALHGSTALDVTVPEALAHFGGFGGKHVGENGDDTLCTESEHGNDLIVVATVNGELIADQSNGFHELGEVAACFLDGVDVRVVSERRVGFGLDVHARKGGYVVKNDGLIYAVRNAGIHMNETSLGGFVVVGGNDEERICADFAGALAKSDGVFRIVASCACDDGNSARNAFNGKFDRGDLFVVRQGGSFARGAANDECVDACVQLVVDDMSKCFVINFTITEGGDERGSRAGEDRSFHKISFLAEDWQLIVMIGK